MSRNETSLLYEFMVCADVKKIYRLLQKWMLNVSANAQRSVYRNKFKYWITITTMWTDFKVKIPSNSCMKERTLR